VYMVSASLERGSRAEPPVGSRGKAPHQGSWGFASEAGGILISVAKNKIETEMINSNKSQIDQFFFRLSIRAVVVKI